MLYALHDQTETKRSAAETRTQIRFSSQYILIAKACARFGAIEDEIAKELNIGPATLDRWKQKYPEFRCALKAGKEASDDRVERSLYQLAIGWNGQPPNTTAAIFWLKKPQTRSLARRTARQSDRRALYHHDSPMTEEQWIRQSGRKLIRGARRSRDAMEESGTARISQRT